MIWQHKLPGQVLNGYTLIRAMSGIATGVGLRLEAKHDGEY